MSDKRGPARRRVAGLISLISAILIITGALVAAEVGTTSPPLIAIGVIGWMGAAMAGWVWMTRALLQLTHTLTRVSRDIAALSEQAREHREKLNAESQRAVAARLEKLETHAMLWLLEHQGQVQSTERHAHAIQHALGAVDQCVACPPDELAERRAAR